MNGIEKEGKNYRLQTQAQKRKKFSKEGNCKLSRQDECEVTQEIKMRMKIAEFELNFERYRKKNEKAGNIEWQEEQEISQETAE